MSVLHLSRLRASGAHLLAAAMLLAMPWLAGQAQAADAKARLEQVKQQRAELARVREQLESRLGSLGKELKTADTALVSATVEVHRAQDAVDAVDAKIAQLEKRQGELTARMRLLESHMKQEAAAARRQSGRNSLWLDMLFDARVAEIPHRQYLLSKLVQRQQQDRTDYAEAAKALDTTRSDLAAQRKQLDSLRAASEARRKTLQQARDAKQELWDKVHHDAGLKAARDAQLAAQEEALKKLLAGSTLIASDNADDWTPMRQQKGKLPWPMLGRIVATFHSPTAPGRPSLAGVQLAPSHGGGQVRAIASGQVRYADWFGGYGLMIIVDHGDGLMTVYAHNNALYKQAGDWVAPGDVLADAGSTGWVKTTRLYFEVRDRGRPRDPRRWCRRQG